MQWLGARLLVFVLVAMLGYAGPADADQNDPRLDRLFADLQSTRDPAKGGHLGREIARIWAEYSHELINKLMDEGRLLMTGGDNFEALKRFRRVVLIAPEFAEGWNKRAHVHYLVGDYDSAISDIERALDLEPRHFLALAGLGLVYTHLGHVQDRPRRVGEGACRQPVPLPVLGGSRRS